MEPAIEMMEQPEKQGEIPPASFAQSLFAQGHQVCPSSDTLKPARQAWCDSWGWETEN